MKSILKTCAGILIALILIFTTTSEAWAFCGFYVGGADAKLFNEASQVIIAHKDNKTILTMANDFQGAIKDFALVVPVPVAIKREQVNIGSTEIIKKLDTLVSPVWWNIMTRIPVSHLNPFLKVLADSLARFLLRHLC